MGSYPGRVYSVYFLTEAIAASTWYILLDKSNTALYGHPSGAHGFNLLSADISTEKAGDGVYDIWLGVVYENDATDGSMGVINGWQVEAVGNPTDSTDRMVDHLDFTAGGSRPGGLDLTIASEVVGSDLLTDGAFANWTGDELDSWTESSAQIDAAADATTYITTPSAKLTATASGAGTYIYQAVSVDAGCIYKLEFYYKNTAADVGQYAVRDATNGADIIAATDLTDSTSWSSQQARYFIAPDSCASIQIRLGCKSNSDIVWFDEATLKKVTTNAGPMYLAGLKLVDQVGLQNDAKTVSVAGGLRSTAWGGASMFSAAPGDVVLCVEEVSGTGTIDVSLRLDYTIN